MGRIMAEDNNNSAAILQLWHQTLVRNQEELLSLDAVQG